MCGYKIIKIEYIGYDLFKSYPLFLNKDGNKYEKKKAACISSNRTCNVRNDVMWGRKNK